LLFRPDEGARAYAVGRRGAVLPDHVHPGTIEDLGRLLLGLHQHSWRNASVVIDRDNHLWIIASLGLCPGRERERQQERS